MYVHRILGQSVLGQQVLNCVSVEGIINDAIKPVTDIRPVAIAYSFNKQFSQRLVIKGQLAEYIKDLAAQSGAFFIEL